MQSPRGCLTRLGLCCKSHLAPAFAANRSRSGRLGNLHRHHEHRPRVERTSITNRTSHAFFMMVLTINALYAPVLSRSSTSRWRHQRDGHHLALRSDDVHCKLALAGRGGEKRRRRNVETRAARTCRGPARPLIIMPALLRKLLVTALLVTAMAAPVPGEPPYMNALNNGNRAGSDCQQNCIDACGKLGTSECDNYCNSGGACPICMECGSMHSGPGPSPKHIPNPNQL